KYQVKVVDDRADWAIDTLTVNVAAGAALPNSAPVAKAGADITITLPTSSVTLNGSASTDSDGSISSYKWAKISGPAATITTASAASTTVTGLVQGSY